MCDVPLAVEIRDKYTKENLLNVPEFVYKHEPSSVAQIGVYYKADEDLLAGVYNGTDSYKTKMEVRFTCDKQFVGVRAYENNNGLSWPSTSNPEEGMEVPRLLSSKTSENVGGCMLKYDGAEYENTVGGDSSHFSFHCRPVVDENYHGGVNFEVSSDNNPIWKIGKTSEWEEQLFRPDVWLLSNDLTYKYNTYVAPAINTIDVISGSKRGGNIIRITGSKFTEEPVVKVGYQNCIVINFTKTEIRCELQESDSICEDTDLGNNQEYPGNPGLSASLFNSKEAGFKASNEISPENDGDYYWTTHVEDGFVQSSPKNWYNNANPSIAASDEYSMTVSGFFVAPRTGYFKFISFGDDTFFFKYNQVNSQCPINVTSENWHENGELLTGAQFWTYPNEFRHESIVQNDDSLFYQNSRQVSLERFYLEKGEQFYVRGAFAEGGGGDYIILGAIYVGDRLDENDYKMVS